MLKPRLTPLAPRLASFAPTEAERSRRRRADQPHQRWYGTARWKRMRERQLKLQPLCRYCEAEGRVTVATTAEHKIPHRGDPTMFWDANNLQSLCTSHHSADKQAEENGGRRRRTIGIDGWPI